MLRAPTKPTFRVLSGGVDDTSGPFVAGNTYVIACESTEGNPMPRIAWALNGEDIKDKASGNSLTLSRKFTREDRGANFSCAVKNNAITDKLVSYRYI